MKILNKLVFLAGFSIIGYGATFEVSTTAQLRQAFEDATANGEDDTIILNAGTYKTTDDGFGTFKFSDIEAKNLIIRAKDGVSKENIVLDGNNTNQVLNLTSTVDMSFKIDNISIKNGKDSEYNNGGGGVYTNRTLIISNSIITNNIAYKGGGISVFNGGLYINDSIITNNTATNNGGGIFLNTYDGSSRAYGFGFGSRMYANKIVFSNNVANEGGAIYGDLITIEKSQFISNNSTSNGSAIYGGDITIFNSLFKENKFNTSSTANSVIYTLNPSYYNVKAINNTFYNNEGVAIYGSGVFINNVFLNNINDISFKGTSYLYNNNIDNLKLLNSSQYTIVKKNNLNLAVEELGVNADGTLNDYSKLIDVGLSPTSSDFVNLLDQYGIKSLNSLSDILIGYSYGYTLDYCNSYCKSINSSITVNFTDKDLFNNTRISGMGIDMGAYEYVNLSNKPSITNITIPSTIKVFDSLSFGITASASGDRTIVSTLVDYEGDGTYVDSTVAYKYTNAGTYTAKVKVIDSSSEEKIVEQTIVVNELTREEAIDYGKNICITNPSSCGLGGTTTPNILNTSDISTLSSGQWYLMGTSNDINDLTIFNSASIVWIYEQGAWKVKSPNGTMEQSIANSNYETIQLIKRNQGFWIKK